MGDSFARGLSGYRTGMPDVLEKGRRTERSVPMTYGPATRGSSAQGTLAPRSWLGSAGSTCGPESALVPEGVAATLPCLHLSTLPIRYTSRDVLHLSRRQPLGPPCPREGGPALRLGPLAQGLRGKGMPGPTRARVRT